MLDFLVQRYCRGDPLAAFLLVQFSRVLVLERLLHLAEKEGDDFRDKVLGEAFEIATQRLETRLLCRGREKTPVQFKDETHFRHYVFGAVRTALSECERAEWKYQERNQRDTDLTRDKSCSFLEYAFFEASTLEKTIQDEFLELFRKGMSAFECLVNDLEERQRAPLSEEQLEKLRRFLRRKHY